MNANDLLNEELYLTPDGRTVDASTMDTHTAAPLDLEKFRKLLARSRSALHGGGADPERDLAREKAEQMARDAGLSFEAAVDLAEGKTKTSSPGGAQAGSGWSFNDFFAEERRRRDQARRHPFPETAEERLIREALVGHDIFDIGLDYGEVDPDVRARIRGAIPWPKTIREALTELGRWNALEKVRKAVVSGYWLPQAVSQRRWDLIEFALDAEAVSLTDALMRARWLFRRDEDDVLCVSEVKAGQKLVLDDLERMADRIRTLSRENAELRAGSTAGTEKPFRRSNADKRNAVEAILREPGSETLSLRAVADRAGVSPEYVRMVRAAQVRVKD